MACFLMAGCGGSSGGGNPPGPTVEQGAKAASGTTKGANAGTGLSDIVASLGNAVGGGAFGPAKPASPLTQKSQKYRKIVATNNKVAQSKIMQKVTHFAKTSFSKTSFAVSPSSVQGCTDGGTMEITGFDPVAETFTMQIIFKDCREDGTQTNGPVTTQVVSTSDPLDLKMSLGDADTQLSIQSYQAISGNPYANLESVFTSDMTIGFNVPLGAASGTFILTADGQATYNDFSQTTKITFTGFKNSETFEGGTIGASPGAVFAPGDILSTYTSILNGGISESETRADGSTHSVELSYDNFTVKLVETSSATGFSEDVTYTGRFSIDFTPDEDCGFEGDFSIQTLTPLHYINNAFCPVAGHMVVNDGIDITINIDESIVVKSGGEETTFTSCEDFLSLCEFEDFQVGAIGNIDDPVSGEGLLVTLTWTDNDPASSPQVSDMDLHVGYYDNPNPASGPSDALVAWHTESGLGATNQFGPAGAVLDFDDTDGLGPEHVTVSGLPAGYYVIAVNSFDLVGDGIISTPSTTVIVTVKIGEEVFPFPTHTFSVDDGDGTNPDAWYRVTDLRCATAGSCVFVAPNLALQVHDTVDDFKPSVKKKK